MSSIMERMRNIYYSYRLCKHVLDNVEVHECPSGICKAKGTIGTMKVMNPKALSAKRKFRKDKPVEKIFARFTRDLVFTDFVKEKEYIEEYWCDDVGASFLCVTHKGIELTDNIFLPFTPIGLWKEIWKEHKVVFTLLPLFITLVSGLGISPLLDWILNKI